MPVDVVGVAKKTITGYVCTNSENKRVHPITGEVTYGDIERFR